MQISLLGKKWNLVFKRLKSYDGICDPPSVPNKEIWIKDRLSGVRLLEVLIHEMNHGSNWRDDESIVAQQSRDQARALWRLGYRRVSCEHGGLADLPRDVE